MKPTNTNIAKFYGLTRQTVGIYRKSKDSKKVRIYEAIKYYFELENS